jgi:preprotein translocase SecE subunit
MADQIVPEVATAGPGKLVAARDFLLDTRAEMDKVSWPPKDELIKATKAVLISALVLGLVIGLIDRLLQAILVGGVAALKQ